MLPSNRQNPNNNNSEETHIDFHGLSKLIIEDLDAGNVQKINKLFKSEQIITLLGKALLHSDGEIRKTAQKIFTLMARYPYKFSLETIYYLRLGIQGYAKEFPPEIWPAIEKMLGDERTELLQQIPFILINAIKQGYQLTESAYIHLLRLIRDGDKDLKALMLRKSVYLLLGFANELKRIPSEFVPNFKQSFDDSMENEEKNLLLEQQIFQLLQSPQLERKTEGLISLEKAVREMKFTVREPLFAELEKIIRDGEVDRKAYVLMTWCFDLLASITNSHQLLPQNLVELYINAPEIQFKKATLNGLYGLAEAGQIPFSFVIGEFEKAFGENNTEMSILFLLEIMFIKPDLQVTIPPSFSSKILAYAPTFYSLMTDCLNNNKPWPGSACEALNFLRRYESPNNLKQVILIYIHLFQKDEFLTKEAFVIKRAIPFFRTSLKHKDMLVRQYAACALVLSRDNADLPDYLPYLMEEGLKDHTLRFYAVKGLCALSKSRPFNLTSFSLTLLAETVPLIQDAAVAEKRLELIRWSIQTNNEILTQPTLTALLAVVKNKKHVALGKLCFSILACHLKNMEHRPELPNAWLPQLIFAIYEEATLNEALPVLHSLVTKGNFPALPKLIKDTCQRVKQIPNTCIDEDIQRMALEIIEKSKPYSPQTEKPPVPVISNNNNNNTSEKQLPSFDPDRLLNNLVAEGVKIKNIQQLLAELSQLNAKETAIKNKLSNGSLLQEYNAVKKVYVNKSRVIDTQLPISQWDRETCFLWASKVRTDPSLGSDPAFLPEMLAVINRGVKLVYQHELRDVQILALLLMLDKNSQGRRLAQMHTGEGKSLVIAVFALILFFKIKQPIDVLTRKPLAVREAEEKEAFFKVFGVSVAHNAHGKSRGNEGYKSYEKNIVYGDASNFEFDILREGTEGITRGLRPFAAVIIDEVDEAFNQSTEIAHLSSERPGREAIIPVLLALWRYLEYIDSLFFYKDQDCFWKHPAKAEPVVINNKEEFVKELLSDYFKILLVEAEPPFTAPDYLRKYAEAHVSRWIKAAYNSFYKFEENKHYVITTDANRYISRVTPIDYAITGVVLTGRHFSWEENFLSFKHGFEAIPPTDCTNFMSTQKFLNLYTQGIYGFTGTLEDEEQILMAKYRVDRVLIPTFKERRLVGYPDRLLENTVSWLQAIVDSTQREIRRSRAVLIMCETIKDALIIKEQLQKRGIIGLLYTRNDNEEYRNIMNPLKPGDVIVTTNLGGRGLDLKADNIRLGLHFLSTFLQKSRASQNQGEGRTGRNESIGSKEYLINLERAQKTFRFSKDALPKTVEQIRARRDQLASAKLQRKITYLKTLEFKDSLALEFSNFLQRLRSTLPILNRLQLNGVEEQWGYWLAQHTELDKKNASTPINYDLIRKDLQKQMLVWEEEFRNNIFSNPYQLVLLGNHSMMGLGPDKRKYRTNAYNQIDIAYGPYVNTPFAFSCYQQAIRQAPVTTASAYYNQALFLIICAQSGSPSNIIANKKAAKANLILAFKSIEETLIPQLQVVLNLIAGIKNLGSDNDLSRQYTIKIQQLKHIQAYIDHSLKVLEDGLEYKEIRMGSVIPVESIFPNSYEEILHLGFQHLGMPFVITELEQSSSESGIGIFELLCLGTLAVCTGFAGALLATKGFAVAGSAMIAAGVGQGVRAGVLAIQGGPYDLNKDLGNFGPDLAIALGSAGLGHIMEKALANANLIGSSRIPLPPQPAQAISRTEIIKAVQEQVKTTLKAAVIDQAITFGLQKLSKPIVEDFQSDITREVRESVDRYLERADIRSAFNKILAVDLLQRETTNLQKLKMIANELIQPKQNQGKHIATSILERAASAQHSSIGAAIRLFKITKRGNEITHMASSFCAEFGKRIKYIESQLPTTLDLLRNSLERMLKKPEVNEIILLLKSQKVFDQQEGFNDLSILKSISFGNFQIYKEAIIKECQIIHANLNKDFGDLRENLYSSLIVLLVHCIMAHLRNDIVVPAANAVFSEQIHRVASEIRFSRKEAWQETRTPVKANTASAQTAEKTPDDAISKKALDYTLERIKNPRTPQATPQAKPQAKPYVDNSKPLTTEQKGMFLTAHKSQDYRLSLPEEPKLQPVFDINNSNRAGRAAEPDEGLLDYARALVEGPTSAVMGLIRQIMDPYGEIIEPMKELMLDAIIIFNSQDDTLGDPYNDGALLRQYIKNNPELLNKASYQMQNRKDNLKAIPHVVYNASGAEKTKMASKLATEMILPGYSFRFAKSLLKLPYRAISSKPPVFRACERPYGLSPVETLSVAAVKKYDANYMYVITVDGKLLMAKQDYFHFQLALGKDALCAGEFTIENGKIIFIDNRSGSYFANGPHLEKLVEETFVNNGFPEARGTFIDHSFTLPRNYWEMLPTKPDLLAGAALAANTAMLGSSEPEQTPGILTWINDEIVYPSYEVIRDVAEVLSDAAIISSIDNHPLGDPDLSLLRHIVTRDISLYLKADRRMERRIGKLSCQLEVVQDILEYIGSEVVGYGKAITRGSLAAVGNIENSILHPLDEVVIPITRLISDLQIRNAAKSLHTPHNELLKQLLEENPRLLIGAENRMQDRREQLSNTYKAFVHGSGKERAEMTASVVLGFILSRKLPNMAARAASNIKHFGSLVHPPLFNDWVMAKITRKPKLLSADDVRELRGERVVLYGFTKDRQLLMALEKSPRSLNPIKHHDLMRYKQVYAAGEAHFEDGFLKLLNDDSGRYLSQGPRQAKIIENAFINNGFNPIEVRGKYVENLDRFLPSRAVISQESYLSLPPYPPAGVVGSILGLDDLSDKNYRIINFLDNTSFDLDWIFPNAYGQELPIYDFNQIPAPLVFKGTPPFSDTLISGFRRMAAELETRGSVSSLRRHSLSNNRSTFFNANFRTNNNSSRQEPQSRDNLSRLDNSF